MTMRLRDYWANRHHRRHGGGHLFPPRLLSNKLFPAGRRKPVILEFAISFLRHLPLSNDPALALHAMKSRIQRAVLHLQHVFRSALYVFCDLMAMGGTEEKRSKNEHIERALQESRLFNRVFGLHDSRHSTLMRVDARPLVRLA